MSEDFGDWAPVAVGPLGSVMCPRGWLLDAEGGESDQDGSSAVISPDGKARLVIHAVVHGAESEDDDGMDFASRMEEAARRVMMHLVGQAGADAPDVLNIEGGALPILEVSTTFFDDPLKPTVRVRQSHALAPMDSEAKHIGVIAFSFMTPALSPIADSEDIAAGFKQSLRAAAAALTVQAKA